MPNLRPFTLIGLASAAAAIASPAFRFQGTPRLDRPDVYAVIVRRDTIWFCARAYPNDHHTAYAFVRGSRTWLDGRRSTRCERERRRDPDDTMFRAGGGVTIHVIHPAPGGDSAVRRRSYLVVTDSARRRRIVLRPRYTAKQVEQLEDRGTLDVDTTSVFVRDAIVNDSLIWIGLFGGFPEGEGVLGGVYRINRRTGAWRHIIDTTLSVHAVNAIAEVAGTLWIATEQPGETEAFGNAGLLRMRTSTMRWQGFNEKNSPLPDALIQEVAADRRAVAVATETGLVVGETNPKGDIVRWNARQYAPAFIADSLVMKLVDSTSSLTDSAEVPFIFMQRFGATGHERALVDVTRRVDADTMMALMSEYQPDAGRLLAEPGAIPAIATLLRGGRESQRIAADALVQLNAPAPKVAGLVRSAFLAIDTVAADPFLWAQVRAQLGRALNRSNDSTGIKWARTVLERSRRDGKPSAPPAVARWDYNIAAAARIAGDARDAGALTDVVAIAPLIDRRDRWLLVEPLLSFDMPSAWQTALALTESGYFERWRLIVALGTVARADSAPESRIAELLTDALGDTIPETRRRAIVAARRTRLSSMVAPLVRALDRETGAPWVKEELLATLVALTGRTDAPAYSADIPHASADWWNNLLATSGGTIPVVSAEDGQRALNNWTRRRGGR